MHILYVANTCSREKYREYQESKNACTSQQAQKYNLLLAEGLAAAEADVHLISTRPITRKTEKKYWMKGEKEHVNGVSFSYIPFLNCPVFRQIFLLFGVFFRVLFSPFKKKETVVVCDALNLTAAYAVCMASFFRGYRTVAIITDVPGHLSYSKKLSRNQKMNLYIMRRFKGYLLLTKAMSEVVNPKNRSYIVLEGHADLSMVEKANTLEGKAEKKICLYAGSLMKIYGIGNLVEGFVKANVADSELHIYGTGDFLKDIQELSKTHENVKYMGVAPNSEIVEAEIRATLLVNPRPSEEDYTKYSFPSKNMEYMASGTPVLTTKLPGMPADHLEHVYLIEDESADGIASVLKELLTKSEEELFEKGKRAKKFVLEEKNNKKQAQKVLDFCARL